MTAGTDNGSGQHPTRRGLSVLAGDLRLWRRIHHEIVGHRLATLGLLALQLMATPLFLLSPIPLAIAVDSVLSDKPLPGPVDAVLPDFLSQSQLLLVAAVLQVGVVLLTDLQSLAQGVLRTKIDQSLTLSLRSRLLAHAQQLSFAYHDRRGTSDSLYRIQFDTMALGDLVINCLLPLVSAVFTVGSVFLVIAAIDGQLAVIALVAAPLLAVLSNRSKKSLRYHYKEFKELESSALGVVHEVIGNIRVVTAFGREDSEHRRFLRLGSASAEKQVGIALRIGLLDLAINFVTAAGTGLVLFVGAQRVLSGALTLGAMLIVLNYLGRLYGPLKTITRRVSGMQNAYESLQRAFELLDQKPDVMEVPNAVSLGRAMGHFQLDNISFSYTPGAAVIDGLSVEIPAGTRVGIVGRTGVGKSTLVSLLMRFYDVSSGAVLLDGHDVRDVKIADLRKQFAIVLQDPVLFSTSIAENIRYGKPDATPAEIRQAAYAAGISSFIDGLPGGYDAVVGERGQRLSGGERQRIALARAFLKDAPVLVLDEPTSSVDMDTESSIMEAMEALVEGRTTFMIAHRLSTLGGCDMLIHVEGGRCSIVSTARQGSLGAPASSPPENEPVRAAAGEAAGGGTGAG